MDPTLVERFSPTGHPWLDALLVAVAAGLAGFMIHGAIDAVFMHVARRRRTIELLVLHARGPARWLAVLVGVYFAWQVVPQDLPYLGALDHATSLALIVAATALALGFIRAMTAILEHLHPVTAADNLQARKLHTQARVLGRVLGTFVVIIGVASALFTFPGVRQLGAALLASAGVVGIVAGFAARPVLGNLIAGLQIALTQPIRIDDVLVVEGEWGRVEEITGAFVVVKIWDERRLVLPLQYFIEKPFQNWTRSSSQVIGTVFLWVDFRQPVEPLRAEVERLCAEAPEWDRRVAGLQVTEAGERAMQVRALVSAADAGKAWDLRCRVREGLVAFMQREYPGNLPRARVEAEVGGEPAEAEMQA